MKMRLILSQSHFHFHYRKGQNEMETFIDITQLETIIKAKIEKEFKAVEAEAKQKSVINLSQIKSDILGQFVAIVNSTFIEVFDQYYGNNYDVNALISSIQYYQRNNFRPDFSYDERKFLFTQGILDKIDGIDNNNLNSKSQANFQGYRDPEEYVTGYIENFWQDDPKYWEDSEKDEDAQEYSLVQDALDDLKKQEKIPASSLQFVPVNTMKRITGVVSVAEVYKMARYKALTRFNTEFTTQIKPKIQKKYRLKL